MEAPQNSVAKHVSLLPTAQEFLGDLLPETDQILLAEPNIVPTAPEPLIKEEQNFQNVTSDYVIDNIQDFRIDRYFRIVSPHIHSTVANFRARERTGNLKFKIILTCEFTTPLATDIVEAHFNRPFEDILTMNNFPVAMKSAEEEFRAWLDRFQERGSGFTFERIIKTRVRLSRTTALRASSYFPYSFPEKRSILNIRNEDNKCFLWSIIAKLFPPPDTCHNKTRVSNYTPYENRFNMNGITYPVALKDIPRFEKQHPGLAINVFALEKPDDSKTLYPVYISNASAEIVVDLLYLEKDGNTHYCLIKDLNSFLSSAKNYAFPCRNCLQVFRIEQALLSHREKCVSHNYCKVVLPALPETPLPETPHGSRSDSATLSFSNPHFCSRIPVVFYADFETVNRPISTSQPSPDVSYNRPILKQEIMSMGYQIVSDHTNLISSQYVSHTGKDVAKIFVESMVSLYRSLSRKMKTFTAKPIPCRNVPPSYHEAKECYMCHRPFGKKVIDHCHYTGAFRGAACQSCNTREGKASKIIPVFFHNGSGFDFHFIVNELVRHENQYDKVTILPRTTENYISISYGNYNTKLVFLDSYRFTLKSLADIARSLEPEDFRLLRQAFPEDWQLLTQKGIYPYEYIDSLEKLQESSLPPLSSFYSTLTESTPSPADYSRAQKVWNTFGCKTLLDYHDLYLKTDVLILADAFEKFRHFFLSRHSIDPCYCYSAPGLTWQCGFRFTGINLDLLTDYDMLLTFEKGIRGGFSGVLGQRYVKANNPYLPDYDSRKPSNYLLYLDANNLYGWAMSQPLPTGDFRWEDPLYFWNHCNAYGSYPYVPGRGYVFEVDLLYNPSSKLRTKRFPLAPESKTIQPEDLSEYQRILLEAEGQTVGKVTKLLLDLKSKRNYVVHYRLLQYYLKLGLQVTYIHRIISFKEEPWLSRYIDFNTTQRTKATSAFEKDLWKLMNNAFYGKTLENIRDRKQVKLTSSAEEARKMFSKPNYKDHVIFSPDLLAILTNVTSIKFNKPIYLGMCILDFSKLLMYQFYYEVIDKLWPDTSIIGFDTDSYFLNIKTEDVYKDMEKIKETYLDTADYPKDHPLFYGKNKKVIGKFKDELNGAPMSELVFLRSKAYSFRVGGAGPQETKRLKGIGRTTVKKYVTFDDYKNTLFSGLFSYRKMYTMNSSSHEMYVREINKKALSAYDDKRWIADDGIETLPYGW